MELRGVEDGEVMTRALGPRVLLLGHPSLNQQEQWESRASSVLSGKGTLSLGLIPHAVIVVLIPCRCISRSTSPSSAPPGLLVDGISEVKADNVNRPSCRTLHIN
jgi:hypothetical protein